MKTLLTSTNLVSFTMAALLASAAAAQTPHYTILDLGQLPGGKFAQAAAVNNRGTIAGIASLPDGTQHSMFWYLNLGIRTDVAPNGPAGINTGLFGVNDRGEAPGQRETTEKDPNHENFCGYGTGLKCQPFLWRGGMNPLPLLGGNNGTVGAINNRGETVGVSETDAKDPQCPSTPAVNGTGPQLLNFQPVIWGPATGAVRKLPLLKGDTVGVAVGINDVGQAVGTTGTCANTLIPPFVVGPHAVLWDRDGSVIDLGSLGGTVNTEIPGTGNVGFAINNAGQVTGQSALPAKNGAPSVEAHAILWIRGAGMKDLGTLPGDGHSAGLSINDHNDIVGGSIDQEGNPRPFFWHNGEMSDLNEISSGAPLYLLLASSINDNGVIVGFAANEQGEIHAFAAMPANGGDAAHLTGGVALRAAGPIMLSREAREKARRQLDYWRAQQ